MKKFLSDSRVAAVLLAVAVISLAALLFVAFRPVSHGMGYYNVTEYDGVEYRGIQTYGVGKEMTIVNTNFGEEVKFFYYYKDGYVFSLGALTEEGYAEEVRAIEENFEAALATPFYAMRINAFTLTSVGPDGYSTVYTCYPAIMLAAVLGGVTLIFIAFGAVSAVLYKKNKNVKSPEDQC